MKKIVIICLMFPVLVMAQHGKRDARNQKNTAAELFPCSIEQSSMQGPLPRNVIFVVGDGMGTAQVYSSVVAQGDNSVFLQFPYSGFSRTYSRNRYTTDSGAGGSALMTGHKVDNYHIALGPRNTWYPSFLVTAKRMFGMAAGFVVTSSVLDATPASTYAHVSDRHLTDSISMQMAQCGFEVMIGGDMNHFLPENRKDGLAPLDTLKARGYKMAFNTVDLSLLKGRKICGLLTSANPEPAAERGNMLTLSALKAIETLNKNDNGFCLMIEGSQIDWACHNNDSAYLCGEMADFENMLCAVLDFAKRDGETLVIVTADHETGGLTLLNGNIQQRLSTPTWKTSSHSGVMVPVFSYGPGAEHFAGIQQNTDFYNKILYLLHQRRTKSKDLFRYDGTKSAIWKY